MTEFEQALRLLLNTKAVKPMDLETGWMIMAGDSFWLHDDGISDMFGDHIQIGDELLREFSELFQENDCKPLWII